MHLNQSESRHLTDVLSRGYICDCLFTLATRHPQGCSAIEIEGGCTCSQVSPVSATCCKSNSMSILQHYPSNFVAEPAPVCTCKILVSQPVQHKKDVLCCQYEKNIPRVAEALNLYANWITRSTCVHDPHILTSTEYFLFLLQNALEDQTGTPNASR